MQSNNQSFSANDSRNEFMNTDSQQNQQSFQQMMQFFQMMKQNPYFKNMMNMPSNSSELHSNANQSMKQQQHSSPGFHKRQFQLERSNQNKSISPRNSPQQYDPRPKRHQKGKDVLRTYIPSESRGSPPRNNQNVLEQLGSSMISNFNEEVPRPQSTPREHQMQKQIQMGPQKKNSTGQRPIQPVKLNPYDDQPIRPMKGNFFEENNDHTNNSQGAPKSNLPIAGNILEDKPIKSTYADKMLMSRGHNKNQSYLQAQSQMESGGKKQQIYKEMEDRPITGANKDFDQILKEQLAKQGLPTDYNEQHHTSQQNENKAAKTFLRKGTREHLSSGRDKRSLNNKKKVNNPKNAAHKDSWNNQNQPALNDTVRDREKDFNRTDRDATPKNNRSVSHNRVLNKKRQDHSINKGVPKIDTRERKQFVSNNQNMNTSFTNPNNNASTHLPPKNKDTTPRRTRHVPSYPANLSPRPDTKHVSPKMRDVSPKQVKLKKPKVNVFEDSESQNQPSNASHSKGFESKKTQVFPGIFLTEHQIYQIARRNSQNIKIEQEKLSKLRAHYSELCEMGNQERVKLREQFERQKEAFEHYKISEMNKIKNERRVIERQNKTTASVKDTSKQELENLKKELEREKQEGKKRDKNNKILLQKSKKESQELRNKISQLQQQLANVNSQSSRDHSVSKSSIINKASQGTLRAKEETIKRNGKKVAEQEQPNYKNSEEDTLSYQKSNRERNQNLPDYQTLKSQHNENKKTKYNYIEEENKHAKSVKTAQKFATHNTQSQNSDQEEQQEKHQNVGKQSQNSEEGEYYPDDIQLSDLVDVNLSIQKVTPSLIERLFKYNENPEYIDYLNRKLRPGRKLVHTSENALDGRTTHIYNDDGKEIVFNTGVKKEYFSNGYMIIHFKNGDVKQKLSDGTILYYFHEKQVDQITLPNQINIYRFENNQIEFHFPDNRIQIRHPDGTIKVMANSK